MQSVPCKPYQKLCGWRNTAIPLNSYFDTSISHACNTAIPLPLYFGVLEPLPAWSLQYAQDMFDGLFQTADTLANQVSAASGRCSRLLQVHTSILYCWRLPGTLYEVYRYPIRRPHTWSLLESVTTDDTRYTLSTINSSTR